MIAKIKTKNGVYSSVVFGIIKNGWKTKAIVIDETNTTLQIINYWRPRRRVFVIDASCDGWIKIKDFEGYDWVYQKLKKRIFKIQIADKEIIQRCKEMQSKIKDCEWHSIKSTKDIEDLDTVAINFHDGFVTNMDEKDGTTVIDFSVWDCHIILELSGDVETNLHVSCEDESQEEYVVDLVMDSHMFFENGYIHWVDVYEINNAKEIYNSKMNHYFRAKNVKWKVVV